VTTMLRVVIADAHERTAERMRAALDGDRGISVCAIASDAAGAIDAALEHQPDVCLLDIGIPGNGLAAAWEITARLPDVSVIILTVSDGQDDLFAALRAGAAGYLIKDMDLERLPYAVRGVVRGEAALPRALMARVIQRFRDPTPPWRSAVEVPRGARLTSREWQVLRLMDEELTTNQIARRLSVTPATIRSHRSHILRKLGIREGAAPAETGLPDS
jgi:DNA-binding NarL/FixJ family response regulator